MQTDVPLGGHRESLVGQRKGPAPPRPAPLGSRDVGFTAVVFPGQVAGSSAAGHPHHRELLGVTRDSAWVGAHARVLPQHGVCGPQSSGSGLPDLWGGGPGPSEAGDGMQGVCPLPSVGLAQSLYCWGLHTGALPGGPDRRACLTALQLLSGPAPPHSTVSSPAPPSLPGMCIIRQPHFRAT